MATRTAPPTPTTANRVELPIHANRKLDPTRRTI
jgi:hypothetical protein